MQPAIDFPSFLALGELGPGRNRREKPAKAGRMAAHAFADGALRDQFQLKALGPVGFQKGAVVARARIGADHLAHAPGIDQPGQAVIAVAGVVGDDGQLAGPLFVKCIEQIVGDPDGAKSCHQYRRSVANPGYGVGGGLDLLVDHVKGLLWAALSFGVRGLCRDQSAGNRSSTPAPRKPQIRSRDPHRAPVGRPGECRDDRCNANGSTVTFATKILVAKSLPRASNWNN